MLHLCWEEEEEERSCGGEEGGADSAVPSSGGRGSSIGGVPDSASSSPELQGAPKEKAQNRAGRAEFGFLAGTGCSLLFPAAICSSAPSPSAPGDAHGC